MFCAQGGIPCGSGISLAGASTGPRLYQCSMDTAAVTSMWTIPELCCRTSRPPPPIKLAPSPPPPPPVTVPLSVVVNVPEGSEANCDLLKPALLQRVIRVAGREGRTAGPVNCAMDPDTFSAVLTVDMMSQADVDAVINAIGPNMAQFKQSGGFPCSSIVTGLGMLDGSRTWMCTSNGWPRTFSSPVLCCAPPPAVRPPPPRPRQAPGAPVGPVSTPFTLLVTPPAGGRPLDCELLKQNFQDEVFYAGVNEQVVQAVSCSIDPATGKALVMVSLSDQGSVDTIGDQLATDIVRFVGLVSTAPCWFWG